MKKKKRIIVERLFLRVSDFKIWPTRSTFENPNETRFTRQCIRAIRVSRILRLLCPRRSLINRPVARPDGMSGEMKFLSRWKRNDALKADDPRVLGVSLTLPAEKSGRDAACRDVKSHLSEAYILKSRGGERAASGPAFFIVFLYPAIDVAAKKSRDGVEKRLPSAQPLNDIFVARTTSHKIKDCSRVQ